MNKKFLFTSVAMILLACNILTSGIPTVLPKATDTPTHTPYPTISPTPVLGVGSTWISPKDGMVMRYVPTGEFLMGNDYSEGGENEDGEKPPHKVYLDSYWMDQNEVTNVMFTKFVTATGYVTDAEKTGRLYSYYQNDKWHQVSGADWKHPRGLGSSISGIENHPVVQVSWNDAKTYCEWRRARLPTEAEWEKAASWDNDKKEKRIYPWGNTFIGSLLNFCDKNCPDLNYADTSVDDGYEFTSPAGNYPGDESFYGLLDMAGNVSEWVMDWLDFYYYASSPSSNPTGPISGDSRVVRGGAWSSQSFFVRSATRSGTTPENSNIALGFRCARSETSSDSPEDKIIPTQSSGYPQGIGDDLENGVIVGKWVGIYQWKFMDSPSTITITFYSDGTGVLADEDSTIGDVTWSYQDDQLTFKLANLPIIYTGKLVNDRIEGTMVCSNCEPGLDSGTWSAIRQ